MPVVLPNSIDDISVPFELLNEEGYNERYSFSDGGVVAAFKVAWADRKTFISEMLGGVLFSPTGANAAGDDIAYLLGVPHWDSDLESLRATEAEAVPFDTNIANESTLSPAANKTVAKWDHARVNVKFTARGPAQNTLEQGEEVAFVDEEFDMTAEMLTGPQAGLCWALTGSEEDQEPAGLDIPGVYKMVPYGSWSLTFHQLIDLPDSFFDNAGKVNSAAVKSPKYTRNFAVETLLYEGIRIRNTYSLQLRRLTFSATLNFKYRGPETDQTWNTFWKFKENAWKPIYTCGAAQVQIKPYNTADLATMLGGAFS